MFIKQQRGRELWVIFFYCVYTFLNDTVLLWLQGESPTEMLTRIFTYVEYAFYITTFWLVIQNRLYKKILLIVSVIFLLSSLLLLLKNYHQVSRFDSISITVEAIIFIITSLFFFFEQISKPQTLFIYQSPAFWIAVGILLYFAGAFFIFIYAEKLTDIELQKYWEVNYAFNATKNILFAIGFLVKNNKEEYPPLTGHFDIIK